MTDLKLMESKEPSYEVTGAEAIKCVNDVTVESSRHIDGRWLIGIHAGTQTVVLTGAEAIAVAEFIATHVRKRW